MPDPQEEGAVPSDTWDAYSLGLSLSGHLQSWAQGQARLDHWTFLKSSNKKW